MILDYPWVEVYLPKTIKEITESSIKRNRREIIREYQEEFGELNTHPATLFALHTVEQALQQSGVEHSDNVAVIGSSVTSGNHVVFDLYPILHSETGRARPLSASGGGAANP